MSVPKPPVALIGSGVIGRAWAIVFACAGHPVRLHDRDAATRDSALRQIAQSLALFAEEELVEDAEATQSLIAPAESLAAALDGAAYVQESVTENVEIKREVFRELDGLAPADAILASSASAIPGSRFMEVPGRARCLIAHPVSPPSLVPLVELVPTPWTAPEVVTRTRDLLAAAGQSPVILHKEITGFVLNRLQAAVISEAMSLVGAGVISPDDLDRTMRDGLGLRWSFMGPFETMDLNADEGIGGYLSRYARSYEVLTRDLKVAEPWSPQALAAIETDRRRRVPAHALAERRSWRDRQLMRLMKLRRTSQG